MTGNTYCPRCGTERRGSLRFCANCAFDFAPEISAGSSLAQPPVPAPAPAALPPPAPPARASTARPRWQLWAAGLGALFIIGSVANALGGRANDEPGASLLARASATPTSTPRATPRPTPRQTAAATHRPTPQPTPVPVLALSYEEQFAAAINLSYDELFRNAEAHVGESIYYRGEVIQVLGEPGDWQYRIDVTLGAYDIWTDTVLVAYAGTDRFLEDDIVDFVGLSLGPYTYESVLGGDITIPLLAVDENGMRLVQ